MESVWSMTQELPKRSLLTGDISADAAIIGGGMAGVLTAYRLWQQGLDAVVLEACRVGSGQTKGTTAKITSQHGLCYNRLISRFGEKKAAQYAKMHQAAIERYEEIIRENAIDCDFRRTSACLYTVRRKAALRAELDSAVRLGVPAEPFVSGELPVAHNQCLCFPDQAEFHPLKFLRALSAKLPVYEETRAVRVGKNRVVTDRGTVAAKHIVFATHYPFVNFPGFYFARMHQERSYVLALGNTPTPQFMYYGIDPDGLSFRTAEGKLLLGGGGHRTGKGPQSGAYGTLRQRAKALWPDCRITAAWSAQDCITLDGVPYIGRFSVFHPNWYVATGFGKWGMTSSMVAADLLCEEIVENRGEDTIFSPRRFPPAAWPALGKEVCESTKGLFKEMLYFPGKEFDRLPPGQGAVIRYQGKKRGAYKDERGRVYLVSTRCPHLGCQLEWNSDEKSWDCPCHGSRFTYLGELIDDPAQRGLQSGKD